MISEQKNKNDEHRADGAEVKNNRFNQIDLIAESVAR